MLLLKLVKQLEEGFIDDMNNVRDKTFYQ